MKRSIFLIFIALIFTSSHYSQNIDNLDFISPINDGMIAIKKGNQWGFIDAKGEMVINFRDDLVVSNTADGSFPIFHNGRSLITQKKDGIPYFGFIDTSGKTIIEPQYLNATPFQANHAIVLLLRKTELAKSALSKTVVSYDYFEVLIDQDGEIVATLIEEPKVIGLTESNLRKPPVIHSKYISGNLFAVMNAQKKWSVVKVN